MQKIIDKLRPLLRIFLSNYMPRWIIFGIDLVIVAIAFSVLWYFRTSLAPSTTAHYIFKLCVALTLYAFSALLFRTYRGVVRFSSVNDLRHLALSAIFATALFELASIAINEFITDTQLSKIHIWFPIIMGFMVVAGQIVFRFAVRSIFEILQTNNGMITKQRTFILGVDNETVQLANNLLGDQSAHYKPVAFITLENNHSKKYVCGLPILYVNGQILHFMEKHKVRAMLVTKTQLDLLPREFYDKCIVDGLELLMVNTISKFGTDQAKEPPQINKIRIEDLLGRNVIEMDKHTIEPYFKDHVVMITGAAGSIGSEIARQVISFNCKELVLIDHAETPLNDLWLELKALKTQVTLKPIVANVSHKQRMRQVFNCAKPHIVFHAAAYKHVPMMEFHPSTAVVTNVLGTRNCADLAVETGVKRFVMISTDKAVNPTNVMGATKRAAEIYIQSLALHQKDTNHPNPTEFVTTRFGNVLGSSGSVVPLFKRQIESGGPVTITHKDISRYFMTIPEACSLVLEAGCTGHSGEIYIFDMGEAVKIYDLAQKMIRLSGKTPGKDIQIVETGLRPGEKLYEELLAHTENTLPTYHKKIMIAKVRKYRYNFVAPTITELTETALRYDLSKEVVMRLKLLIPEFKSQNSDFAHIDTEIESNNIQVEKTYAKHLYDK